MSKSLTCILLPHLLKAPLNLLYKLFKEVTGNIRKTCIQGKAGSMGWSRVSNHARQADCAVSVAKATQTEHMLWL